MSSDTEKSSDIYPLQKSRLYMSVATVGLSIILATAILLPRENSILLLSSYVACMLIIAVVTLKLRIRFLKIEKPDMSKEDFPRAKKGTEWKKTLLVFLILLIVLAIPLLMAGILPLFLGTLGYYIWFILVVSLASGISIAEILLYLHLR